MWVTGKCKIINESDKEVFSFISSYKHILLRWHHPSLLGIVNYIPQPSTFWRRDVLKGVGLFDESLRYVMDYDYWFRISQRYRLYYINEYLAKFRVYPSSKTWQSAVSHEDEEEKVVKRYVNSKLLISAHKFHRQINSSVYLFFQNLRQK